MESYLLNTVSPFEEMTAYEAIWSWCRGSLKDVAHLFERFETVPTQLLSRIQKERVLQTDVNVDTVRSFLERLRGYSVSLHGDFVYPVRLRDAKHPVELFYYRGDIGLTRMRSVSVVGARKSSVAGLKRAARVARGLVEAGFAVVSGLAEGIDTAAMTAAIDADGRTIGVIGTPINESYPRCNRALQERVAAEHLLVSQVPFYHYSHEHFQLKKRYFPERNETMSALSEATVIIEASDTSGSLTQARACLQQGRKLFILNSCFDNPEITWPSTYAKRGAIRVKDFDDIFSALENPSDGHLHVVEEV